MDTDALRWFQQVADGVTVTEVSDLEMVSQSGVSRALARLEDEIGVPLLRRAGRTLRMTHAGAEFKRYVDAMLHNLDDGLAAVGQLVDPESGTVTLGFQQSLGTWLVPDLIRSFHARHPRIKFELTQVSDDASPAGIGERTADLELSTRRYPGLATRSHTVTVEPLRLAMPNEHRLRRRRRVSLAEVADEPFVGLRATSGLRRLTDVLCQRAGFTPQVVFAGDDLSTVRGLVASGLGLAIVPAPRAGSAESTRQLHYCAVSDEGASREVRLQWAGERRLAPATAMFQQWVIARSVAGKIPALAP